MTKKFIESVLLTLAKERKVFWSEADFQFAFAWKLKEMFEDSNPQSTINVRLERRTDALEQRTDAPEQGNEKENSGDIYIDIWVEINEKVYPIELKYKTIQCTITDGSEEYKLKQHGACDIGCYLYLKDVERIEHISKSLGGNFEKGMLLCSQTITCIGTSPKRPQTPPSSETLEFMTGGKLPRARDLIGTHHQIVNPAGRKNVAFHTNPQLYHKLERLLKIIK